MRSPRVTRSTVSTGPDGRGATMATVEATDATRIEPAVEWSEFAQQGFTIIRGAVPTERADAARRAINQQQAEFLYSKRRADRDRLEHSEATRQAFDTLLHAPRMHATLTSLLGTGWIPPATHGQIAINYPGHGQDAPDEWHVDGMGLNQAKNVDLNPFSVLVCIALSPQRTGTEGNLKWSRLARTSC
mmetsp:Transcript_56791/g.168705  ORF Transcript_56791/g.168705 Transcript_56791/m.168705 type:complete len:188 (+) Transcript_56791:199-762(+)